MNPLFIGQEVYVTATVGDAKGYGIIKDYYQHGVLRLILLLVASEFRNDPPKLMAVSRSQLKPFSEVE